MSFVSHVEAPVLGTVRVCIQSVALLLLAQVLALIDASIRPSKDAKARDLVLAPIPFVEVVVRPLPDAKAVLLSLDVVAFELATIWPVLDAYTSLLPKEPLTLVSLFIDMHRDTDAMLQVVHEASLVDLTGHVVEGALSLSVTKIPLTLV